MIFFKRKPVVGDIQASSLTGNKIEQSASGKKNNPYLLQDYKEQEAEETNDDADVNSEANTIRWRKQWHGYFNGRGSNYF